MRIHTMRFMLLAFLVIGFSPAFAVNDDVNDPCFGTYSLGWLDAEFYWRENTTWYKLATNDFDASYPGSDYTCYLSANTADKETVSLASVPAVCEAASSGVNNSCLVFQAKQWTGNSNRFYRANLGTSNPTDWGYVETWIGSWGQDELKQTVWDQMVETTDGGPLLYWFTTTNHTDFQNYQTYWDPAAASWSIYSLMKEAEVRIRSYVYSLGYYWMWYDTDSRSDSFKQFQVNIVKGGGMMALGMEAATETLSVADTEKAFYDLAAAVNKSTVTKGTFGDMFAKLFMTTNPEDEYDRETTALKSEENEKGAAVAITVETVDKDAGEEAKLLLEGMTIIAVNGIALYDLGTVEEQVLYLVTEKIGSVTLVAR